jgi:hypothetical protein
MRACACDAAIASTATASATCAGIGISGDSVMAFETLDDAKRGDGMRNVPPRCGQAARERRPTPSVKKDYSGSPRSTAETRRSPARNFQSGASRSPRNASKTGLNRRHDLQLAEADMAGVGLAPCRPVGAKDVGDHDRRRPEASRRAHQASCCTPGARRSPITRTSTSLFPAVAWRAVERDPRRVKQNRVARGQLPRDPLSAAGLARIGSHTYCQVDLATSPSRRLGSSRIPRLWSRLGQPVLRPDPHRHRIARE